MKNLNVVELKEVGGGMSVTGFYTGAATGFITGMFVSSFVMNGGHKGLKINAVGGDIAQIANGGSLDVGTGYSEVVCGMGFGRRLVNTVVSAGIVIGCTVGGAFIGGFLGERLAARSENGDQGDL